MKHIVVWLCAAGTLTLLSEQAHAGGCLKDTDCKGDRVCENGRCVAPTPAVAPALAQPPAGLFEAAPATKAAAAPAQAAAQPAPPKDTGPTLEESLKFIEAKLDGLQATYSLITSLPATPSWEGPGGMIMEGSPANSSTSQFLTHYEHLHHTGCVLTYSTSSGEVGQAAAPQTSSIDFKDVDPGSLRVAQTPPTSSDARWGPDNRVIGQNTSTWSGWHLTFTVKGQEGELELGDNGQEMGTHLANAFARSAQLCGAKASPF